MIYKMHYDISHSGKRIPKALMKTLVSFWAMEKEKSYQCSDMNKVVALSWGTGQRKVINL